MSFTQQSFATVGAQSTDTPNLYSYKSTDSLSIVLVAGYFVAKQFQLEEGDFILSQLSDFNGFLEVDETSQGVKIVTDNLQKTAYGELATAQLRPEIQISAEYNSTGFVDQIATGGSTTGATGGEYFGTVGTGATDIAAIFSKTQIIPSHGQGSLFRFSARFDAGVASSRMLAGAATASDAIAFGYEEAVFGTFYTHGGAVVVYELQVTGAAAGGESATVTINGTGYTVPLTVGTVNHNASEIATSLNAQVPLYNFSQVDDLVVLRSILAAPETGAFTFSSATATGTFTQIAAGVMPDRDFTPQTSWNVDTKTDLDPSKTNYYSIRHNGDIEYYIQDGATGTEVLVHQQELPNALSAPIFGNSSFRMVWSVSNFGNTTPITISGSHGAAFIEGLGKFTPSSLSEESDATGIGTTLTNILTIRVREVFGTQVNLGRVIPLAASAFSTGTKGTEIEIICDATFSGETDYTYENEDESIVEIDTTANTITGGELLSSKVFLADAEVDLFILNDRIQSGSTLTLAMRVIQTPTADTGAALVWREEF